MRGTRLTLLCLAAALALGALVGAGCGDKKPKREIPAGQASEIRSLLSEVKRRSDPLRCNDIHDEDLPRLDSAVNNLPSSVSSSVRNNLRDGVQRLRQLVDQECANRPKPTPTTPTETTPEPTTPEPTTPPPTTTPPETTPPETTPPETTPPEGEGNGGEGGGGGQGGNGGTGGGGGRGHTKPKPAKPKGRHDHAR